MVYVLYGNKLRLCVFFFFQAEDGIRDHCVTEFRRVLFRSPAVPFINSQALRRNHASKRTASRAPSLTPLTQFRQKHISHRNVSRPESEVGDSHDLRARPRTAPSETQRKFTARRRVLCSNNLLLLSSSAQIVSGSRSTTQSSNLANSTRRGINLALADSFSCP